MPATRTQIYLSDRQRRRIEDRQQREGKSMAAVIRDAIDAYLNEPQVDLESVLDQTFGSLPELTVPTRREWTQREDRGG